MSELVGLREIAGLWGVEYGTVRAWARRTRRAKSDGSGLWETHPFPQARGPLIHGKPTWLLPDVIGWAKATAQAEQRKQPDRWTEQIARDCAVRLGHETVVS